MAGPCWAWIHGSKPVIAHSRAYAPHPADYFTRGGNFLLPLLSMLVYGKGGRRSWKGQAINWSRNINILFLSGVDQCLLCLISAPNFIQMLLQISSLKINKIYAYLIYYNTYIKSQRLFCPGFLHLVIHNGVVDAQATKYNKSLNKWKRGETFRSNLFVEIVLSRYFLKFCLKMTKYTDNKIIIIFMKYRWYISYPHHTYTVYMFDIHIAVAGRTTFQGPFF